MDCMNELINLRESFAKEVALGYQSGVDLRTLTAFCDWIRQQSIRFSTDEYLRAASDTMLDLCVSIKVSKTLTNEPARKMAGNIYLFSQSLTDVLEGWKIAIGEDRDRKKQEVREKLDQLIDSLEKFDELFSWKEFNSWLPDLTPQSANKQQPQVGDFRGKVDFVIITIKPEEFEAVLERFPGDYQISGRRYYSIGKINAANNKAYQVAVTRCTFQGEGEAQDVARDAISDLQPRWILVVGIAGGVPSTDFTLGDVVLSTKIYDMTVKAVNEGSVSEYAIAGGPGKKSVTNLVAFLHALKKSLSGWNELQSIGRSMPPVSLTGSGLKTYGSPEWQAKVTASLQHHFGSSAAGRKPIFISGPILSSDTLVKDTQTLLQWLQVTRDALAIEMEAAGIYRAARSVEPEIPFLAIRGISDLVGLKRHQDWTSYACHSASAFALAFVKGGFI